MQGAGGVIVPPDDYFERIRAIAHKLDGLLIADEVITGFGRTGRWFGLERYGVEPDIIQFAKGITSGYIPLGGVGISDAVREAINGVPPGKRWMHAFTYSGHPTCCAVALKNIDILEREQLSSARTTARVCSRNSARSIARRVGTVRGLDDGPSKWWPQATNSFPSYSDDTKLTARCSIATLHARGDDCISCAAAVTTYAQSIASSGSSASPFRLGASPSMKP